MKTYPVALTSRMTSRHAARLALILILFSLVGCGAWQSAKTTTGDTTRAIFTTKVKSIHLTIASSTELNRDDHGASLPVALRVYQMKTPDAFLNADYARLVDDTDALRPHALKHVDVTLLPGQTTAVDQSVMPGTQYVGVVAFFRSPSPNHWKLVIPLSHWKKARSVPITVDGNRIEQEHTSR